MSRYVVSIKFTIDEDRRKKTCNFCGHDIERESHRVIISIGEKTEYHTHPGCFSEAVTPIMEDLEGEGLLDEM